MNFRNLRLVSFGLLLLSVALLSGCGQSPEPKVPWALADDGYDQVISSAKGADGTSWMVQYSLHCKIEIDADGAVHVYGTSFRRNGYNCWPNIKVSGKGRFIIHEGGSVKVSEGAFAVLHSCTNVKVMPGATVEAHNCSSVTAADGAKVEAHGVTTVERVAMPNQQPGQQQPEQAGTQN